MQIRKDPLGGNLRLSEVDHGVIWKVLFTPHFATMAIPIAEWMIMDSVVLAAHPTIQGLKSWPVLKFLQMQVEPIASAFFKKKILLEAEDIFEEQASLGSNSISISPNPSDWIMIGAIEILIIAVIFGIIYGRDAIDKTFRKSADEGVVESMTGDLKEYYEEDPKRMIKLSIFVISAILFLSLGAYWVITRTDFLKMIGLDQ